MDKAVYIDFISLHKMNKANAFFVTRAKVTMDYRVLKITLIWMETAGLRSDRIIKLKGPKSK
jgi:type IV secretory pathway VirB3-like protein